MFLKTNSEVRVASLWSGLSILSIKYFRVKIHIYRDHGANSVTIKSFI